MAEGDGDQRVTNALILQEIQHMQEDTKRSLGRIDDRLTSIEEKQTTTGEWIAAHDEKTKSVVSDICDNKKKIEGLNGRLWGFSSFTGLMSAIAVFLGVKQ